MLSNQRINPSLNFNIILTVNSSTIEVNGDFLVTKVDLDTSLGSMSIETSGNSKIHALKNMILEFNPATTLTGAPHRIALGESAELLVQENLIATIYDKNRFDFSFTETSTLIAKQDLILDGHEDSQFKFSYNSSATSTISKNLHLSGSRGTGTLNSEVNLNAGTLNVDGDINMNSDDPTQVVRLHISGV